MEEDAKRLNLRHDAVRTCHSYYRDMRLIHEYFDCDPAKLNEAQIRDYFIFVKTLTSEPFFMLMLFALTKQ